MIDDNFQLTKEMLLGLYSSNWIGLANNKTHSEATRLFHDLEFPTANDENWRHTPIKQVLSHQYIPAEYVELTAQTVNQFTIPGMLANLLVFVNGHYAPSFSQIIEKPEKLIVQNLATAKFEHPAYFDNYFNASAVSGNSVFTALNTAVANDGVFIYINDNQKIENPILVLHLNSGGELPTITQNRNLFIAGKNSEACIIEAYRSVNESVNFINSLTEISLSDNAALDYYIFQGAGDNSFHLNNTYITQNSSSRFNSCMATFCGALVRNDIQLLLNGANSEASLNGVYLPDKQQHFDNYIYINHAQPNCTSSQLYRGVVDNQASASFFGKVYVAKDAQKTNAYQSNKNVLLNSNARVNSKPQLEIYADDVKCTHGSTVGKLDSEALFYLQARGLPENKAKIMLLSAFFTDVLEKIHHKKLRNFISFLIEKRLHGDKVEHQCLKIDFDQFIE